MGNPLDGYGLPVRYAAIGAIALPIGTLLSHLLGVSSEAPGLPDYLLSAVVGAVGGYVGGLLRRRAGKKDLRARGRMP